MKWWQPDTCECKIEEIYEGVNIIGAGVVLNKCIAHQSIPDSELYSVLLEENYSKNRVMMILLGHDGDMDFNVHPDFPLVQTQSNGNKDLAPYANYNWEFDEHRNIRVDIDIKGMKLSKSQKEKLQKKCDEVCAKKIIVI